MAVAGYRRIRKLGEEPDVVVTTLPKNNKAEGGYVGWALLTGLGIGAGLFALAYKIFHKSTWKLGDVLSVPSPEGAKVYTVTGIDTNDQIYGLSPGIWPDVGPQEYFTFSELRALGPVLIEHVEIP
ncbi:MAG: hypothetical protein PHQ43_07910 [Dehalococcoidales bacterium]|nr:hypothetical protein [Dehalococcoidales bacterium]